MRRTRRPKLRRPNGFEGTDGALHAILPSEADAYTVVIFFSPNCHVLAAHDDRMRKLAADFAPRRVRILAVDPEIDASARA